MSKLISLTNYGGRLAGLDDEGQVWLHNSKEEWVPMTMNGLEMPPFGQLGEETGADVDDLIAEFEKETEEKEEETNDKEDNTTEPAGVIDPDE